MASSSSCLHGARRYERIKDLGEGTWGVVFLALDRLSNKRCAVKRIKLGTEKDR